MNLAIMGTTSVTAANQKVTIMVSPAPTGTLNQDVVGRLENTITKELVAVTLSNPEVEPTGNSYQFNFPQQAFIQNSSWTVIVAQGAEFAAGGPLKVG